MEDFKPQEVKGPDKNGPLEPQSIPPENVLVPEQPPESGGIMNFLSNNKWYVIAIVAGLFIIGALAAFAFWPRSEPRTQEAKVQLSIEAPQTTQAGGEVIYRIQVLNEDSASLTGMNLELVYDDGMSYVSSSPKAENISGTSFSVPDLAPGQNAILLVKTLAQGNVNDNKRLVARLRYKFDNFSSTFTAETNHTTRLIAANVILDISGKQQVNSGESLTYNISYRNTSTRPIDNGRIQVKYPEGFEFSNSSPATSLANNIWNLSSLTPNQSGQISFQGTMGSARVGQSQSFIVEFLVPDDSGNYFTQSSVTYDIEIATQPLSVDARVTSGGVAGGIVRPGSQVAIEIRYQNNTQLVNTGLQLLAEIDSSSIVNGSIQTEAGFVQDQVVNWNASSRPTLEQLNVGQSGTVTVRFTIANPATTSENKDLTVVIRPRIKSNQNAQFLSGGEVVLKIASPSELTGGVTHAGGSLPPKVGTQSSFRVRLALKNSSNDYREGVLIGYVPVGVNLDTNSITQLERSSVQFDVSTGKLTWSVGQLVAHAGRLRPERVLEFTVSTTPGASQVGQAISLFRDIDFTATDSFTSESIQLDTSDLSSANLPEGSNQGRVTP